MGYRYNEKEILELCKIPLFTDNSLDQQNMLLHEQVPLTRKCIVDQCLFWCDVAQRLKHNLHSKKAKNIDALGNPVSSDGTGDFIVGVVGCGSIGSKFVRELVKREIVKPNQIKISSRTPSKAKQRCGLDVIQDNVEVASHCTVLFLFVLPFHFRNFSREIREAIQGSRPLVISTLAGFTSIYLQRALNTPFLITTGIDMSTIKSAANHIHDEYPLGMYATDEEITLFQEYFADILQESSSTQALLSQDEKIQDLSAKEKVHNPFKAVFEDPKQKRKSHQAAFAAENLSNCGIDFLTSAVTALKDWISLDPAYARIQLKEETFNKLWERSFIPLSSIDTDEDTQQAKSAEEQAQIRFMLKRAFVRSLLGNVIGMSVSSDLKKEND